jgi:integrase
MTCRRYCAVLAELNQARTIARLAKRLGCARCHTFRATGITDYLTNGGRIEVAQRMAGHSNAKTTGPGQR